MAAEMKTTTTVKRRIWNMDDEYNVVEVQVMEPFKEGNKVEVTVRRIE